MNSISARRAGAATASGVAAVLIVVSGCGSLALSPHTMSRGASVAEEVAIREARASQNRAIASGDLDRVAAFWTEDVSIRRGLGQLLVGRAAYRQLFEGIGSRESTVVYQREATTIDVSPHWPLAFETGSWAGHLGAGGPVVIRGRYSAQWVKREGHWLIRSEVFVALTCAEAGCGYKAVP